MHFRSPLGQQQDAD